MSVTSEAFVPADPLASARQAGLRHVDPDAIPGITRVRRGKGFAYVDAHGKRVTDDATLERIRKLAIPSAWGASGFAPSQTVTSRRTVATPEVASNIATTLGGARSARTSEPETLTAALEATAQALRKGGHGRRRPPPVRLRSALHDRSNRVLERGSGAALGR
jgi:hypothetical protein